MSTRLLPRSGQTTFELDYADPARLPYPRPNLRTVDLFCGCGGMSLGFQNAGFDIVAAYDKWEPSLKVYRANFRHPAFSKDLSTAEASDEIARLSPELIVGGPPCQDFSSAGPQNEDGQRAGLTPAFASIVGRCRPKYFVFENVQRAQLAAAYKSAKSILAKEGYGLTEIVLDAAYCGVPQTRKRLFLIGALGASPQFLEQHIVARLSSKPLTLRDYFGDELGIDYYFRIPTNYSKRAIFGIDEPCRTIRAVDRPMPANYKLHPSDPICPSGKTRVLTTRERARVQTFPSGFELDGTKTDLNQMIGNAVPVKLAEFVAQALAAYHSETCGSLAKVPAKRG